MFKISIIIPVYNVEKYIEESLNSIISQSMRLEDIQVIMVDDNSSDSSYSIMKKYSDKYENFISIKLDTRSGAAGRPRNIGMKYATGKYIMFLDPDDTYTKNACEILYNTIEKNKIKFVTANFVYMDITGENKSKPVISKEIFHSEFIDIEMLKHTTEPMKCSVCNKIISRDFIEKNNIKFLEDGLPAEDSYFSYLVFMKAREGYYLDEVIYNYRIRNIGEELSVSKNLSLEYFKKIDTAYRYIYEEFKKNEMLDYFKIYYVHSLLYTSINFINSSATYNEKIQILNYRKWYYNLLKELNINLNEEDKLGIVKFIKSIEIDEIEDAVKISKKIKEYILYAENKEYNNKYAETRKILENACI